MPAVTHHLPLCAAAAAAAGWRYHKALRSCSGEGLAFICRWVELHEFERREEKGSVHVCERKESKEGRKEGGGEGNREKSDLKKRCWKLHVCSFISEAKKSELRR